MAMTRKHYREFADLAHSARVCEIPVEVIGHDVEAIRYYLLDWFIGGMSSIFEDDNPNFDETKFAEWCANGPPMNK